MAKGFVALEEQVASERIAQVEDVLERTEISYEVLQEAYRDAVNRIATMEDVGWQRLAGGASLAPGSDLEMAKRLASQLSEYALTNPLLKRGCEIRNSYLFAEPYEIGTKEAKGKISPQQWNVINHPDNQAAVFALGALESIEAQCFEAGNQFTQWDRNEKRFQQIPFSEIADVLYDPMDHSKIRYVLRSVDYQTINKDGTLTDGTMAYWVPGNRYDPAEGHPRTIAGHPVDVDKRMVVRRVNRAVGAVFGTPDAFAATPWALAYSAYLRDGTKVLAALAEWVWKITPKKRNSAERAAAVVRSERGAGGSLFTDMDVQALPKSDAVDLNTGRPLAAQVAAALGISVVVLLADPGQSGAYGTAQTLSDPNRRTMQARRELNSTFLEECLELIGVKKPAITWAKMAPGTDLEETQLLSAAWGTGLFHADEIRPRMARVAQITLEEDTAPEGVLIPNNAHSVARADVDAEGSDVSMADGSNSMANGRGRDALGVGAVSRTPESEAEKAVQK